MSAREHREGGWRRPRTRAGWDATELEVLRGTRPPGDPPPQPPAEAVGAPEPAVPAYDPSTSQKTGRPQDRDGLPASGSSGPGGGLGRSSGISQMSAAVKETVIVAVMALLLSFVVKTWLVQAFYIPSGSMEETLQINDRVIVSKLTPGPFELRRGDIVVFSDPGSWLEHTPAADRGPLLDGIKNGLTFIGLLPDASDQHLIKRVIGLPGDHVVCCDAQHRLVVNGTSITEPYVMTGDRPSERDFDITVPAGRLWVMGDHRSNSSDSRFHDNGTGATGSIPVDLVTGRAIALVWPLDHFTVLHTPSDVFAKVPQPSPVGLGPSPYGTEPLAASRD